MADLRRLSGRDVCKILSAHGSVEARQRRSHVVMQKSLPGTAITVPVPVRAHRELKTGTLMCILRQSQVSRSAFEAH